jgi:hypothetical protein
MNMAMAYVRKSIARFDFVERASSGAKLADVRKASI